MHWLAHVAAHVASPTASAASTLVQTWIAEDPLTGFPMSSLSCKFNLYLLARRYSENMLVLITPLFRILQTFYRGRDLVLIWSERETRCLDAPI